uniref:Uncharacterized protein n=1 Tax=Anguilla anguilla TaxID=7936 RepID=A0A0E9V491_ANGAN
MESSVQIVTSFQKCLCSPVKLHRLQS